MKRQRKLHDNIFAESARDFFAIDAANAQSFLEAIKNPYVGNKKKLLYDIGMNTYDTVEWQKINTVCDLFAGSSVVGAFFKKLGKQVTSNELLLSSYMHGKSLLCAYDTQIEEKDWEYICCNTNKRNDYFVAKNWGEKRFTLDECTFLDNYYANVIDVYGADKYDISFCVCMSMILQFVMENCFLGGRLNNGQILAAKDHRIAHARNQGSAMNFRNLENRKISVSNGNAQINHGDAIEFLRSNKQNIDLFYIDPPYGGDQSDYAQMYQFCEEYVNRMPFSQIEYLQINSKKFTKNKSYVDSFHELLKALPTNAIWLFSYNNSSWASVEEIENCLKKYKTDIIIKPINYSYKQRELNNEKGVEYLIYGI